MSPYEIRTIFLYLISIRDSLSENKKNYNNCKYEEHAIWEDFEYFRAEESDQFSFFGYQKLCSQKNSLQACLQTQSSFTEFCLIESAYPRKNGWIDSVHGIGLIERYRQGNNRPSVIYVKNFVKRSRGKPVRYFASGTPETGNPDCKELEIRIARNWKSGTQKK